MYDLQTDRRADGEANIEHIRKYTGSSSNNARCIGILVLLLKTEAGWCLCTHKLLYTRTHTRMQTDRNTSRGWNPWVYVYVHACMILVRYRINSPDTHTGCWILDTHRHTLTRTRTHTYPECKFIHFFFRVGQSASVENMTVKHTNALLPRDCNCFGWQRYEEAVIFVVEHCSSNAT